MSVLACTVRGCGLALDRRGGAWICPRGHTYDVARSGYVNLLQPQDRRSRAPGDTRAALEARTRLLEAGVGRGLLDTLAAVAAALPLPVPTVVVELGAGGGEALAAVAAGRTGEAIGLDLSSDAASLAARRFPRHTWVVANADRRLPLLDASVDLILSVHARRNPAECARVLAPGGALIVAVPAPDDLVELREAVQGGRVERDRADAVVEEHRPYFSLRARHTPRERHRLERSALLALLRGTYRGARASAAAATAALTDLEVTLASDVLVFA